METLAFICGLVSHLTCTELALALTYCAFAALPAIRVQSSGMPTLSVPNLCVSNFLVKKNGCRAQLDCLNNLLGTRSFMLMVGFGVSACECQYIIRATTLAKTKSITSKKIVSKIDPSFSL